ncbi:MAG: 3-dehydroquinate dehydratase [Myxococcales bacterium]|nr:3-dehydroquinate dehydratase [Myxococcales bacterium]
MKVAVLNGPNLNLLGQREPHLYGQTTLAGIEAELSQVAAELSVQLTFGQFNGEGDLVTAVQTARACDGILLNAAAYTHTSIALRDAVLAIGTPVWAVHLTDPEAREAFRHIDYLADVVVGRTVGLGARGYAVALRALTQHLRTEV